MYIAVGLVYSLSLLLNKVYIQQVTVLGQIIE